MGSSVSSFLTAQDLLISEYLACQENENFRYLIKRQSDQRGTAGMVWEPKQGGRGSLIVI